MSFVRIIFTCSILLLTFNANASTIFQCNEKNINLSIKSSGRVIIKTNQETCDGQIQTFENKNHDGGDDMLINIFSGLCASPTLRNSFIKLHHYNIRPRSIMPTNFNTEIILSAEPFVKKKCDVNFINTRLLLLLKESLDPKTKKILDNKKNQ